MTITNGYATLAEFQAYVTARGQTIATDTADDAVMEGIIMDASRTIDAITVKWFYADTQTRYFSVPAGGSRELKLDAPLLAITTLTNGDGTVLTENTDFYAWPRNSTPKFKVIMKEMSSYYWTFDSSGNTEFVISIAGSWGYVDRTKTDVESARYIRNTHVACLDIALMKYNERFGQNTGGQVEVTAAGVVITPQGAIPKSAYDAIKGYISRV